MIPGYFIGIAVMLRLGGGISYVRAILRGKAQPSLVSWAFWSLTGIIAFIAQLIRGAGVESLTTLAIALSPLAVCVAAIYKGTHRTRLTRLDKCCIALMSVGVVLWLISRNPIMALSMSILADIVSNVPTLVKGYLKPKTEHPSAYGVSIISMIITLLTIQEWGVTHWLFPAYILSINTALFLTITVFSKLRINRLQPVQTGSYD